MSGTVLVTGASRGVGREIARLLVRLGHHVVGVYRRDQDAATALVAELGDALAMVRIDLVVDAEVDRLASLLPTGALHGVVCSAGTTARAALDADGDILDQQLADGLRAPLVLLRSLLRRAALVPGSSVVFVGSNLARHGLAGRVAYSAAKAGLEGATRALARELGPARIRVNTVAPGLLQTDMTADLDPPALERYAATVPLGRVGVAADVAPVVAFLLGDGAGYITGQTLDVDGGWGA